MQQPPPKRNVKQPTNAPTPSNAAPSPAGVSTPAPTNAPTPNAAAASPSGAPKSPKNKAPTKKQTGAKRKSSTAPTPQSHNVPSASASTPSSHPPNAPPSAPSVPPVPQAQQAQVPEPMQQQGSSGSNKRAREEEGASGNNVAPSPLGGLASSAVMDQPSPPKRAKMEWEGPPSEEMQQRKAMVDGVKTEEDATDFLAQMSELLKMSGNDSQQDSDLTELTNMLLKGVNQTPGAGVPEGSGGGIDAFLAPLDQPLLAGGMKDDFEQYFDFSLGGEDDDSKTPELSASSTTNTSPGSNSGNESTTESGAPAVPTSSNNEVKTEEPSDVTYLGMWKELDGGESASYQSNDWKWDSNMTSLDLPWAIFNTNTS